MIKEMIKHVRFRLKRLMNFNAIVLILLYYRALYQGTCKRPQPSLAFFCCPRAAPPGSSPGCIIQVKKTALYKNTVITENAHFGHGGHIWICSKCRLVAKICTKIVLGMVNKCFLQKLVLLDNWPIKPINGHISAFEGIRSKMTSHINVNKK